MHHEKQQRVPASGLHLFCALKTWLIRIFTSVAPRCSSSESSRGWHCSRLYLAFPSIYAAFPTLMSYQNLRLHYLHNEVTNVDMGFKFYVHIAADAYARPDSRRTLIRKYFALCCPTPHLPSHPGCELERCALPCAPRWSLTPGGAWVQAGASR